MREGELAGIVSIGVVLLTSSVPTPLSELNAMANIKSQKKRNRQNEGRAIRNKTLKSELKTRVKSVQAAAGGENAAEVYKTAQKRIDMAVSKGLLHPNTAARRKSRLSKRIKSSSTG